MALRRSVLSYLEDDAARHSGRCAVIDEGGSCTYGQLYLRARKVGSALAELGVRHRAVVVYMEKGIDALSVMFGALCAGGFYVPVDPQVPAERLARIVGVLQDPLVVADELTLDTAEKVDESTGLSKVLLAEDLLSHPVDEALLACARAGVIDSDPAYVLFTSGSTGTPKGVAVSHRAIIDFIDDFVRLFGFEETDRVANQAPFDFDVSVKDIYGALACGCTLVVVPRALFSQPAALVSYLEEKQVTIMTWAVAALCLITSLHGLEGQTLSSVRRVMFSGEVMPVDHLRTWMDHLPEAVFVNLYGPTEVTCNCLYHIIDRDRAYGEGIPLGIAFPNRQVLLVGEDGSLVTEPGATGEILVRGVSLALGYVGDKERTAAVFTQNPLHRRFPDRVYRTGDLGAYSEAGELFYRGRKDNQIKHQGHRVELEEVDLAIEAVSGVTRCRCVYDKEKKRLIAFYEGTAEAAALRAHALEALPPFMMPTKILPIEAMPLTKNGKVDRAALLALSLFSPAHAAKWEPERILQTERALYALGYHDKDCDTQLDDATRRQLAYGQGLMQLLRQEQSHPYSQHEQVFLLVCALGHVFLPVPSSQVRSVARQLLDALSQRLSALCIRIDTTGQLSSSDCTQILDAAKQFVAQQAKSDGEH